MLVKIYTKKEIDNLSDTARDFLYFVQSFRNKFKLRNFFKYLNCRRCNPRPQLCNF